MGFPRQEYWSGLPFSPPGDLPDPGIERASPALAGEFFTLSHNGENSTLSIVVAHTQESVRCVIKLKAEKNLNQVSCEG